MVNFWVSLKFEGVRDQGVEGRVGWGVFLGGSVLESWEIEPERDSDPRSTMKNL